MSARPDYCGSPHPGHGNGWRSTFLQDTNADGKVDGSDVSFAFAYDEAWRIVATFRSSDSSPKEQFLNHMAGLGGYGGATGGVGGYIDNVVMRDKDANTAWTTAYDGAREERRYMCPNWRADVSAIVTSAGKLAGTITHRQERRSKSGNRFAFVGFSDPSGQFETICFSDTLAQYRDVLEPGKAVIALVEADVDGEEVKLRLQSVEDLERVASQSASGLSIFLKDAAPIESVAKRLTNGGKAPVKLYLQLDRGREVEIALGSKFTVTPQIKGAIKAITDVIDVQDL